MNNLGNNEPADLLDQLFLAPGGAVGQLRAARGKVLSATQGSYEALFDAELAGGLSQSERLLIALYACVLTPQMVLAEHYRECLATHTLAPEVLQAVEANDLALLGSERIATVLGFTRTLIVNPVEGGRQALEALLNVGLEVRDVVTLGQLIAFLSYQVRLAAGLAAFEALGVQA